MEREEFIELNVYLLTYLTPTVFRIPERPARSKSLCPLRHPGHIHLLMFEL